MSIVDYLKSNNWEIVYTHNIPEKKSVFETYNDLGLSQYSINCLKKIAPNIYRHQKEGLKRIIQGHNVCLTTATASGKSLVFQISSIEQINKNPDSKILAIYPLKALGTEQEERFNKISADSGLNFSIGRIDGGVPVIFRKDILNNNQIIIMTPDVVHAWLLNNLATRTVMSFIKNIKLIILDEAHIYSGVFGSNSAFLFRRLNHIIKKFKGDTKYIAASATIENPESHLEQLTGLKFKIIDSSYDGSPQNSKELLMVNPPISIDLLTAVSDLIKFIAANTDHQFITFVDSRKQTEYIASIAKRRADVDESETNVIKNFNYNLLEELDVYPYRAGYEENDREQIQKYLEQGEIKGVISTSALEMGIDIPYLTLGLLIGVPRSATSFYQRIGRIGRINKGVILIINNNTISTKNIFRNPNELLKMPYSQGAIYLQNERIQYIHSLCLARQGGENDIANSYLKIEEEEFNSDINFPENFIKLCNNERIGEIPAELQNMKAQAGDNPNHTYPLRDIDEQFRVEYRRGPEKRRLGSLSFSQLMREAYPGAVYYYGTGSYRVYKVNRKSRLVEVRYEKKYTTKPAFLPVLIFPNMTEGNIYNAIRFDKLKIIECNLQINETIIGYKERRGPTEISVPYPLDKQQGLYFNQPKFTRNYFTTGVLFDHPVLNQNNVNVQLLSEILFESFLISIPLDRQDLGYGADKHRKDRTFVKKDDKFISIFDQTFGSLRLTSSLMEKCHIKRVLEKALSLAKNEDKFSVDMETLNSLKVICSCVDEEPKDIEIDILPEIDESNLEKVILPKSKGLFLSHSNEEFYVEEIFYNPKMQKLMYRGKLESETIPGKNDSNIIHIVPIEKILEIPGVSEYGYYDYNTGSLKKISN